MLKLLLVIILVAVEVEVEGGYGYSWSTAFMPFGLGANGGNPNGLGGYNRAAGDTLVGAFGSGGVGESAD